MLGITSFSHPKLLPQFADAVDVLKRIDRRPDMSYVVLMPNTKGFDCLEVCQKEGYGASEIILMISSSEAHNLLNFRMAHDDPAPSRGQRSESIVLTDRSVPKALIPETEQAGALRAGNG